MCALAGARWRVVLLISGIVCVCTCDFATPVKRIARWLVRIFFAAAVAFSIPVQFMFSPAAFGQGMMLGLFAGVLAKFVCAVMIGKDRWVTGMAMMGRGEFAYLVAEVATKTKIGDSDKPLLSSEAYAIVAWALLLACVVAPLGFRFVLERREFADPVRQERARSLTAPCTPRAAPPSAAATPPPRAPRANRAA